MKLDYDVYEKDKWRLNMHETSTILSCYVYTLIELLVNKGILSDEEINKAFDVNKSNDWYAPILKGISEQRDLIAKYESGEKDPIKDLIADLFGKE